MTEDLEDVYESIREDPEWEHLRTTGIVLVPGEGAKRPKAMIVGEAPGASENTHRRPFVGTSGKVLRSLIVSCAGLSLTDDVFITNVVKYRPPGNRNPTIREELCALPYLRREWKAIGCPRVLVAVGATAKNVLAAHLPSVTNSAGQAWPLAGERWIWPMLHPAYGLRNPGVQPQMEEDWTRLGEWIRGGDYR